MKREDFVVGEKVECLLDGEWEPAVVVRLCRRGAILQSWWRGRECSVDSAEGGGVEYGLIRKTPQQYWGARP